MTANQIINNNRKLYEAYKAHLSSSKKSLTQLIEEYQEQPEDGLELIIWGSVCKYAYNICIPYSLSNNNLNEARLNDMMSEGYIIFKRALQQFDVNSGIQFGSYFTKALNFNLSSYYLKNEKFKVSVPYNIHRHQTNEDEENSWKILAAKSIKEISIDDKYDVDEYNPIQLIADDGGYSVTATTLWHGTISFGELWNREMKEKFKNWIIARRKRKNIDEDMVIFELYYGINHDGDRMNGTQIAELTGKSRQLINEKIHNLVEQFKLFLDEYKFFKKILEEIWFN